MIRTPIGHVATAILREIGAMTRIGSADRQKPMLVVEELRAFDWASVTFVGQRHEMDLRLDGDADVVAAAMVCLCDDLAAADIPMAGHFIAEIRVIPGDRLAREPGQPSESVRQLLRVEALVLRD
jgi:hypothetical protein